eukprot:Gb_34608 [translate_table: standard]
MSMVKPSSAVAEMADPLAQHLDALLDKFSEAAERSVAAAEAYSVAETKAAAAAEKAAQAYSDAENAVGTPEFDKLREVAEAAEKTLENLTMAAASASKDYLDASLSSMDASMALEAAETELYGESSEEIDVPPARK